MKWTGEYRRYCSKIDLLTIFIISLFFLMFLLPMSSQAKPVSSQQAHKAVQSWLRENPNPFGVSPGKDVRKVDVFSDSGGEAIYYIVYLDGPGFVIASADDLVEPVIAFVERGSYDPSDDNPLGALVSKDLLERVTRARSVEAEMKNLQQQANNGWQEQQGYAEALRARDKWSSLEELADSVGVLGLTGISDVRVEPLTETTWDQKTVNNMGTISCYNYYTPPGPDGSASNWPTGCVATALSQYLRFCEYATGGYVWSNMPVKPDNSITMVQQQAIGDLCYDAAVSVSTTFGSGSSSADTLNAKTALTSTFGYSNAIKGYKNGNNIGSGLNAMVNPNLDFGNPVILGITGAGGHAVLADGYGYESATLYHHLNMGWSGDDNAWYNLPYVDTYYYTFTSVYKCIYNIFTSGSGEIISGRITDPSGAPLSGVTVTATGGYEAATNEKGIYALAKLPSGTSFTVSASKANWVFSSQPANTGTSSDLSSTSGNVWGLDFAGTISAGYIKLDKDSYSVPDSAGITLIDSDLAGNGSQNVVVITCEGDYETVALTENPASSGVFLGSISVIQSAFTAENGAIEVSALGGVIIASYQDADNGLGLPAVARDSALVTCGETVIYQTAFSTGLPSGWSIVDGYSDGEEWYAAVANPGDDYWDGVFMFVNSDAAGYVNMDEQLVTHTIDCTGYSNVTLKFMHDFWYWAGGNNEKCDVDVRVNGGSWQNVVRYQGADAYGLVELDLSPFGADDCSNVQIRWRYYDAYYEYYWGIDDVELTGTAPPNVVVGDFEPDCDVDLDDYAIFSLAWQSEPDDGEWNQDCDISAPKNIIDEADLLVLSSNWLTGL